MENLKALKVKHNKEVLAIINCNKPVSKRALEQILTDSKIYFEMIYGQEVLIYHQTIEIDEKASTTNT